MKKNIVLLILVVVIVLGGCQNPQQNIIEGELPQDEVIEVGGEDKEIINRSEDISDYVVELFGIDDAVTIIFNDTAVIGVILAYDQKINDDIKNIIRDTVKEKDELIKEVKITDNKKLFSQINNIIEGLLNGKSYDNYVSEIDKIIEKIQKEK